MAFGERQFGVCACAVGGALDWAATQNNLDNAIQILRVTPSQATTGVFRNE